MSLLVLDFQKFLKEGYESLWLEHKLWTLELCDQSGNVVFKKRQNIYYVKLQEKLCTLDCDNDYILKITSIQDDIKTDEEVIIQNKQACDGKKQGKTL